MLVWSVLIVIFVVLFIKWRQSYWRRRGLYQVEHEFFFGNFRQILSGSAAFPTVFSDIYKEIKSKNQKHGGMYALCDPLYIPIEPELIKNILAKDFSNFLGHGLYCQPKDILSMNLLEVDGDTWKALRRKLTPAFSSGKVKMMFDTVLDKAVELENVVGQYASTGESFPVKEVMARFFTDIIVSCGYGLESNSLKERDCAFRHHSERALKPGKIMYGLMSIFPWWLLANFGFKFHGKEPEVFFSNVVKETIRYRQDNNVQRKDFMQLMIELKDDGVRNTSDTLNENEIIAQCFLFFLAGFETSSTTLTNALLELAQNQPIQDKLRKEIQEELETSDGKITYTGILNMKYLDNVMHETLRKHPSVPVLPRSCTKDYHVPGTDVIIQKGTRTYIPIYALQNDPEYYPNPEVFNPDNFLEENKAKRPDFCFLSFGGGPRMCLGMKFGLMQTKIGLISLIRNYRFTVNEKTVMPLELSTDSIVLTVKGDIWLDFTKL